jgi:PAS domain S-box-containing protein
MSIFSSLPMGIFTTHQLVKRLIHLAGVVLLFFIFLLEYRYHLGPLTVAYLVVTPLLLLIARNRMYSVFIGVLTSLFLVVGYNGFQMPEIIAFNRWMAGIAVWVAVGLSIWIRHLQTQEHYARKNLKAIFDNASEGIILSSADSRILMVNDHASSLFGYADRLEVVGKEIEMLLPERYRKIHRAHRLRYNEHPTNRTMGLGLQLFGLRKDGTEFPLDVGLGHFWEEGNLFVITFITDISERLKNLEKIRTLYGDLEQRIDDRTRELKKAYKALEVNNKELELEVQSRKLAEAKWLTTQKLYDAMARNYPNGLIGVVDRTLRFVLVDGDGLEKMRLNRQHLMGKKVKEAFLEGSGDEMVAKLAPVFEGKPVKEEVKWANEFYSLMGVPLPDEDHRISEALVVITNITQAKKSEENLLANLRKEQELGELKSRFVATASHEFRTPLSTIMSSIFLLENYTGEDYAREKSVHIQRIKRSVGSLIDILNDFLSLEKLKEGKVDIHLQEVDLPLLMEELIQEMEVQIQKEQVIHYRHSGETLILTDKKILRSILLNILSNALKYSKPRGCIEVVSRCEYGQLTIDVADEGIGIPQKDQPYVFKKFFRADNASFIQGTGLGLNIVEKYLDLLQGSIEFTSEENIGTTFTLRFPLESAEKVK